jgi:predicted  nucleic acid-binding Zn-ribbon protein|tara:strand:- start:456 stop:719 length:264 start_codon:yes stop_codon:yes gene_type:complete
MASKYEVEQMLIQSIENCNKQSKHIEGLWDEIGQKQNRIADLNWEITELKSENEELIEKQKEKEKAISKAQYQKNFIDAYSYRRTDN